MAASRLCRAHHVDQDGVQHDQRRARDEVDEDDAEPVVHVEVRVQVLHHEVLVVDAARRHNMAAPRGRWYRYSVVVVLEEATYLRGRRRGVDDACSHDHVRDGAPAVGDRRVADAQVTLKADGEQWLQ